MTTAQLELDLDAVYFAVDARRRQLRMHRSAVAAELGLYPSALTRLDHGKMPVPNTLLRIMAWLDRDIRDFAKKDEEHR